MSGGLAALSITEEEERRVPARTISLKEGWLRKQARNFGRDWGRRYFILTPSALLYCHGSRTRRIELISASVKAAIGEKYQMRRFRLITPAREYLLEAESEEDALQWMGSISETIQTAILDTSQHHVPRDAVGFIAGGKALVEEVMHIPGNEACADCGAPHPSWVSTNLGVVLCIDCSGIHRSLGCQISKVRSLELDAFLPETIQVIKLLGNPRMNAIWEADLCEAHRGVPDRRRFIEDKYVRRAFTGELGTVARTLAPVTSPRGSASLFSPELALFESVQGDNVLRTAELLFRYGVDVNTSHRITGTTPLHMAASAGQLLQAHFLLQNGASAVSRNQQGRSPGEVALRSGHAELVEHLAKYQGICERGAKRTKSVSGSELSVTQRIRKAFNQM
jgi:hypothetical protein